MKSISVIFIVAKYPATYGHTSVINNLCHGLNELGHKTAIGAFSFDSDPPKGVEKVILKKNHVVILTKSLSKINNVNGFKNNLIIEKVNLNNFPKTEKVLKKYKADIIIHLAE